MANWARRGCRTRRSSGCGCGPVRRDVVQIKSLLCAFEISANSFQAHIPPPTHQHTLSVLQGSASPGPGAATVPAPQAFPTDLPNETPTPELPELPARGDVRPYLIFPLAPRAGIPRPLSLRMSMAHTRKTHAQKIQELTKMNNAKHSTRLVCACHSETLHLD